MLELPDEIENELTDLLFRTDAPRIADVEALAAKHPDHAVAIHAAAVFAGAPTSNRRDCPDRIGPYRVVRKLGEGGFGVVFLACREDEGAGFAAVKVLRRGMDTEQVLNRFHHEARVLAAMQHPNIAGIRESGVDGTGRAFFAMEYVDGVPIHEYCHREQLNLTERAELVLKVCAGVAHAHQRTVLHRDLTPRNILVTLVDGRAEPKIIDFGLAKSIAPDSRLNLVRTSVRERLGTLPYMAPEQLVPRRFLTPGAAPDARVDVYAIGALLYELVSGVPAFPCARHADDSELESQILDETPVPPSRRASASREARARELDRIAMRALEKEPDCRYESVLDLARDLERFLRHEPVEARPASRGYRIRKFLRRNRVRVVVAGAASFLLSAIGLLGSELASSRHAQLRADIERRNQELIRHLEEVRQPETIGIYKTDWSDVAADSNRFLAPKGSRF